MGSGQSGDIYAETLAVFDRYEPLTTPEVADALDVKRRTVYKRLQKLVDRGVLETKKTGSNSRVWWRPPTAVTGESAGQDTAAETARTAGRRSDTGYRRIFEAVPDGVLLHEPDGGTIIDANEQFCEMLGYSREELLDLDFEAIHADLPPYTMDRAKQYLQQAATDGPQIFEWLNQTKAGDQVPVEVHLRQATIDDREYILAVVRDITDRKEQEEKGRQTATQLQGILDTIEAAIYLKDTDGQYLLGNQNWREMVGIESDEQLTELTDEDLFPAETATKKRADDQRVFETNETLEIEAAIPTPDGHRTVLTRKTPIFDDTGDPYAICAVATDITDRREGEQDLRAARQFKQELIENAPFGMFRLDEDLRITYENPRAEEIIGLPDEMKSSDAVGMDIRKLPPIVETGKADIFTRLKDGEAIEFEFPFESIYGKEAYFTGRSVPLYREGEFDGAVLIANDISKHRQREQELERQREQLAAVNELNDVVRGITEAVIDQSTRAEIEQVVCDRLAASDSYRFAWISSVDQDMQLKPRTKAGINVPLDDIPLSADPSDPTGQGPIGKAVRSQAVHVIQNALDDPDSEREFLFRSAAAIPIVHQEILYGVLAIYSERPDAFAEEERDVVGQLGEVVGHAIAAVNRKRALMSNEVIELEIRIPQLLGTETPAVSDGTVRIERTVPLGDDEYLVYGQTNTEAMAEIRRLTDQLPGWKAVRTIGEREGTVRFEQRLSDPPVSATIADYGGYFESGQIEDGEYTLTVHLPPGTDIRQVVADIRKTYPNAESISQKQIAQDDQSPGRLQSILTEQLTERQRAALEAGYYGGFFEWPRERSGEEVAMSLDIGASTFHQHVRKAEKKLLDAVFAEQG